MWKPIIGLEGAQWVSTHGRFANILGLRLVKMHRGGMKVIVMSGGDSGRSHRRSAAALILLTFVGGDLSRQRPAHRDGDPTNLSLDNLFWRRNADALGDHARGGVDEGAAWRAALAVAPAKLGPDAVNDIASDMVVAHLSGALALADFGSRVGEFVRAYNRMFSTYRTVSLDQPVSGTEDLRLGDSLSEAEVAQRWDALGR